MGRDGRERPADTMPVVLFWRICIVRRSVLFMLIRFCLCLHYFDCQNILKLSEREQNFLKKTVLETL
jgi:hypothetical protein